MQSVDLIRRLHEHRMWVNANLLETASHLSESQLRQPFSIGQGSVWNTLVHLQAAEYVWLETLLGDPSPLFPGDIAGKLPGNQSGEGKIDNFVELCNRWRRLDERWRNYLTGLTDTSLSEIVRKVSTSSGAGKAFGTLRSDILLHLCTHAQYTTAQALNMFRQLGVEQLPDVMLISLARSEAPDLGR
ncbi:MAG: damage-inducible protein DinB [Planctomyces sp.]|nr:damage-inducible protein DinB [Planctomyces sp.]